MSSATIQGCVGNYQALDHISNLPDAILCHILSFVPTNSAVATSILSKRWRYLWTKVPVLDFTELRLSFYDKSLPWKQMIGFINFVDRVLLLNDVSYVQRLHFSLPQRAYEVLFMSSWLSDLSSREIRDIYIRFGGIGGWPKHLGPVVLPTNFLSRERLVVLELAGNFAIDVQMSLHLPNLETIHLMHLQFPNDEFMRKLTSGCPVLKKLHIQECGGITDVLYVESLSLKTLQILSIWNKEYETCLSIKAPNLRYLYLEGVTPRINSDLSSLVEANLDFHCYDVAYTLQFVRKISGVKALTLGTGRCYDYVSESKSPIFQNMTSLRFESDEKTYMLLECAPKLKSLIFENVKYADYSFESRPVPKCLSCLEHVEFQKFEDVDVLITLAAYFLKTASVLKEMKIYLSRGMSTECERRVYQRLLMLRRSSTACQVHVLHGYPVIYPFITGGS